MKNVISKFGEILKSQNSITDSHISLALAIQEHVPMKIGETLKYCNWISEEKFLAALGQQNGIDVFDFRKHQLSPSKNLKLEDILHFRHIQTDSADGKKIFLIESIDLASMMRIKFTHPQARFLLISHSNFNKFIHVHFSDQLIDNAVNRIVRDSPSASAKFINYQNIFLYFCIMIVSLFKVPFLFLLHSIANIICVIIQTNFKILLMAGSFLYKKKISYLHIREMDLPIYSILIPLYKEANKVDALVSNIGRIHYPKIKLDVKIILEEDDLETRRAFSLIKLPDYFEIILVPFSMPRTKPKAMNYALPLVRGKYVAIYDAEDAPEPLQLQKAVQAFKKLPEEYVCLQSRLQFFNSRENLLTRMFSLEYSIWFRHLLTGLDYFKVPIPLGGTSNHFKVDSLRKLLSWDPYNVTEDADLGIRIGVCGYKSQMLDSWTDEECLTDLHAWMFQRARWIKGFIKTYLIYIKNRPNDNIKNDLSTHFFIFLPTYNFIVLPWVMVFSLYYYEIEWLRKIFYAALMQSCLFHYFTASYLTYKDYQNGHKLSAYDLVAIFLWPFYFILHTIASYIAIFELLQDPFKWNKTTHGTSKMK
jgi:cellulose synthase/poly-beta-1,6-N-acetylglucosamine synthase-like glycosyltransferase